ncbi:hypothetical protein HNO92_003934 [Chromobacterium alkanivorans]|uniref:DUF2848 domain-containing protein n=1 Tax=Chromobacterium alkanivorans TaxID=1071719 RepID=UPI001966F74F|nr:DUF2848 domain-containing protein [Chromobacterium alkanivorans]MBN3002904.1 DUF2848 domain-containing protein [Chromobacterium alkanivorans]MCS3803930.1 hypothetical protein [Chromobacterium alkanivorans]MCS3817965.1 hypothetical protein [Chromobacterium alkanivorans]MCS3875585.1 hypothetical protein [Chromobacterium alkanivorans]
MLELHIVGQGPLKFSPAQLIIAGWTGRDRAAVEHHIRELEALGVRPPASTPCFYPLSHQLLTTAAELEVPRAHSSGEVECVLLADADDLYVGVGSDHTDRQVEAYDVTVSKQMCAKPIGSQLWRFDEVLPHWDQLRMRSWRSRNGARELYQEGSVASLLHPLTLIERYGQGQPLPVGAVLFGGTLAVKAPLGHGDAFELELHDPVLGRSLRHAYRVKALEVAA